MLCCLKYENDNYNEYKKNLPNVGSKLKLDNREGKVISVDVFGQSYKLMFLDTDEIKVVNVSNESKE